MAEKVFGAVKVNYNNLRNKVAFTKELNKLMHNSPSLYFFTVGYWYYMEKIKK